MRQAASHLTIFPKLWDIAFLMLDQQQIGTLRKRMGLSQSEMAAVIGVSSRLTISQWETGFSTPGGPIMRFLCLLDSLSDTDLRKLIQRLEKIHQAQSKAND